MVARFTGREDLFETRPVRPSEPGSYAVARIGELLPEVLERYGFSMPVDATSGRSEARGPETNRPDIAHARRRVG